MASPPSVGTLSKYALDTANPPAKAYEYLTFSLGKRSTVLSTDGIRGTRSHPVERTRTGVYTVSGTISMHPGPSDLDTLLPFIMGQNATGSGNQGSPFVYTPVDKINSYTGASFFIGIDRIAQAHLFSGCQMDRATFRAVQGGFLEMELGIEGLAEQTGTVNSLLGAGFPGLVPSLQTPYVLMDATLTYNATAYQFRQVEVTVDNALKKDRFMNSISRTDLPALDRIVSVSLSLPYTTDEIPLYDQNATAGNVVITFAIGSQSALVFQLPAVQFPTQPPETPGREEILLPLNGIARKTGTTVEITITNYP